MELTSGYEFTDAGSVPADWTIVPLSDVATATSGKRLPLGSSLTQRESPYPYVRVTDMRAGTVSLDDIRYVPAEVFPAIKLYRIYVDDIYISVAGTLGLVGSVPIELNGANLTENANKITAIRCTPRYLLHQLASPRIQRIIRSQQTVGAQPKLALRRIRQFPIPLPPTREEQQAIACALDDVSQLIDATECLLCKKRQIKEGAVQELLTRKRRLPGFRGHWPATRLSEVGVFLKGSGVTRDQAMSGDLACVRYGELYTRHHDIIRECYTWISPRVATSATRLRAGDILFAGSGETKAEIGKCAVLLAEGETYAGGDIVILRPDASVHSRFLGYLLNAPSVQHQKTMRAQGDAVVHISASALSTIQVELPPLDEQLAVATVLDEMDAAIRELEVKLGKAKSLKHAMMQELLTGRIRLLQSDGRSLPADQPVANEWHA